MPQEQGFNPSELHVQIETTGLMGSDKSSNTEAFNVAIVDVSLNRDPADPGSAENSGSQYEYLCGYCDGLFSNQEELTSHMCFKKPNLSILYECQECKTLYDSLAALGEHIKEHDQHMLVVNKSPELLTRLGYRCSLCDKYLSSKGSLVKHQQLHMGLKPYCCSFCNKPFSLKGNRDKHELIHAGERPHKCEICTKTFTLKGNLQQHILTHTSLKMYKCDLCSSEFRLKGNLNKHLKRHQHGMAKPTGKKKQGENANVKKEGSANVKKESSANDKKESAGSANVKNEGCANVKIEGSANVKKEISEYKKDKRAVIVNKISIQTKEEVKDTVCEVHLNKTESDETVSANTVTKEKEGVEIEIENS